MFYTVFSTTFKRKSESIKQIERNEDLRNHLMGVPVRLLCNVHCNILVNLFVLQDIDPLDEIKGLIEKQENDTSKLKDVVQAIEMKCEKQDNMLQKILKTVENLSSGSSRFQSKSVKSMRLRLKKAQLDSPNDSNTLFPGVNNNSIDDSAFPLLP